MNENRVEKKFILGKYKEDFLRKILILNGFTKHFIPRRISSIYLDTLNFDFAKDNINGVKRVVFTYKGSFENLKINHIIKT